MYQGPSNTVDICTSYSYQNAEPWRPYLSSSAFSTYAAGSPDYGFWWVHELSRTAGSPANGNAPLFFYDTMGSPTTTTTR